MRKIPIVTLLAYLGIHGATFAQFPFPDSAAIWVNTMYWVEPFPPPVTYTLLKVNNYCVNGEDTMVNGMNYTKLHYCNASYKGALRDDSGTIYYVPADSTQEYLLYDFNALVGDTLIVYFEDAFGGSPMLTQVVIISIMQDPLLGGRQVTYLNEGGYWIEGVGAAWGLFSEPWVNVSMYELRLECMSHLDTLLWPAWNYGDPGNCPLTTQVSKAPHRTEVEVFPNPTSSTLHVITSLELPEAELTMATPDGRELMPPAQRTVHGWTLDLGGLAKGVYLLIISDPEFPSLHRIVVDR